MVQESGRTGRFLLICAILVLLLPVTWFARSWYVEFVHESAPARQRAAVSEALDEIEARFDDMQAELIDRAENIAEAPVVVRGLRTRSRNEMTEGPEDLIEFFSALSVPYRTSVELYDPESRLVAWNGFSMPFAQQPDSQDFLNAFHTEIAVDANLRQALVIWLPVREGTRPLGAVRVMQLIGYDAPIQNEYLRDISLAEQWKRLTRLPVEVSFEPVSSSGEDLRQRSRLLQGADGTVLGRVIVEPPSPEVLIETARRRFDDVLAFWAALLLFWLTGGLWVHYRHLDRRRLGPRAAYLGVVLGFWWAVRFALLELDIPGRWQQGKAPLSPLFDPMHFASDFGGGLMRSSGDFLITAVFLLASAAALLDFAADVRARSEHLLNLRERLRKLHTTPNSVLVSMGVIALGALVVEGMALLLGTASRRIVLDSTFDFFARKGLLPETLLLVMFCSMILATIGVLLISIAVVWISSSVALQKWPEPTSSWTLRLSVAAAILLPFTVLYVLFPLSELAPWPVALVLVVVAYATAYVLILHPKKVPDLLILRSVLPIIFLITAFLYPLLYNGMDAKRRIQMRDAAENFAQGRDPRVLFAIEEILQRIRTDDAARTALAEPRRWASLDSLSVAASRGSFLASLPAYDISLTFFDVTGAPVGRYYDTAQRIDPSSVDQVDRLEFQILHQMYEEDQATGVMVEHVTGRREPERFQYEGIAPVTRKGSLDLVGWVMARAEPQTVAREGGTPFPRVLLPSGSYEDLTNMSIAEFRDGILVRGMGLDFGRYRLSAEVRRALASSSEVWQQEEVEERTYSTYYKTQAARTSDDHLGAIAPSAAASVIAVRVPSINTFDHLFYLLRVTVAGLFIGLPLYLIGLYIRRRAGLLPAPHVRFRDKVLNAFLGVGIISVAAVGFLGLEVVTGENERAIQAWLRQHLERVEQTLTQDAAADEMPYSVLERSNVDSLASRSGLDLNVYSGYRLVDLSRSQLLEERLIDQRLPIEAYEALFFAGYRFMYTQERVGNFTYTTGFRSLADEQGRPRYVISVPTLPEQERLEEERARTVAYLFGSLLLLMIMVMATASLLANAISRPVARLRSGLKAVAAGRFERMLPVNSRDEIGELVQTFNEMQQQLAESRRELAQQERQLAWREMARQVAHEIKNPLTPMKLSVQHLRRAFESDRMDPERLRKFSALFNRITSTLIEQIDALARIANEFHSFARMPSRIMENLDLNAVVEEAVSLMQEEESDASVTLHLHRKPLIVEADREELRRNYINLVKNALQAIPENGHGKVNVRTDLRVDESGKAWAYSEVADNGTGVEESIRGRIFEPNFSTKTSGAGLGLAIVKKSVEELHGEIGFDTEEGAGSRFWIRLPLSKDEG